MRRIVLSALPLLFLACNKDPDPNQAAVHVKVGYHETFTRGCISVVAEDGQGQQLAQDFDVSDSKFRPPLDVAIFRKEDWGRTVTVTVTAREQNCTDGKVVDQSSKTFDFKEAGVKQWEDISLFTADEDGDGYVAMGEGGKGGTDCDDVHAEARPGVGRSEVCDGLDNDCQGGVDDGLSRSEFFRDADGDGAGAGAPVQACVAPSGYVAVGGDCDDNDVDRTPGKAEVCDEKDNNCAGGVDEALAVRTFHRDSDGDMFGDQAATMTSCRETLSGYVLAQAQGFDCNDGNSNIRPGAAEVCDGADNNCAGGIDEGFDRNWYRDVDNDGYGRNEAPMLSCTKPAGQYVQVTSNTFDCNDDEPEVHPGATEKCNNRDDNCANGDDETFLAGDQAKGAACNQSSCAGVYVCNGAGDGTVCNAPAPALYYLDDDEDSEGAAGSTPVEVCGAATPPARHVRNNTDCQDYDPRNRSQGTEVCDWRDNDCDGSFDEGTCTGIGSLQELSDVAVTGDSRDWRTVALGTDGLPVWVAGLNGVLARRTAAGGAFQSLDGGCAGHSWYAAWVRPSDGHVFLAGASGNLAQHNGAATGGCIKARTSGRTDPLMGLVGFEVNGETTLYAVDDKARLFKWVPRLAPATDDFVEVDDNGGEYFGIHGFRADLLLVAGGSGGGPAPLIHGFSAPISDNSGHTLSGVTGYTGSARAVWQGSSSLAYAVGDNGLVLKWDGTTGWTRVAAPTGSTPNFTSVVALDSSTVYVVDRNGYVIPGGGGATGGKIRRLTSNGWANSAEDINIVQPLFDVAASKPGDFWAVGENGRVIHFPE